MAKTRHRIAINAWLYPERDSMLIERLKDYQGDRATLIVKALENYLEIPADQRRDPAERLVEEIAQLRQAINLLPSRLLNQLTTSLAGLVIRNRGKDDDDSELDTKPVVTDAELKRRRENRLANRW